MKQENKKSVWWKKAVGYQIYPMSFQDSNGDGIGDIRGIINRIDYLANLGIDFIWLNPIYKSPQIDNGYDISDFRNIDPIFGTINDFQELISKLHKKNIKLIIDLVLNHSSDQHYWFQEALNSKDNPYHDYYIWQDGVANTKPNDWVNWSGASEWTYYPQIRQWNYHIFNKRMPDLNWENGKLRKDLLLTAKFWLDMGIDGFRLDAISHLKKMSFNISMKSMRESGQDPWAVHTNVPGLENFLKEIKYAFSGYNIFTVGEASGITPGQASLWTGENGYFNAIFELDQNRHDGYDSKKRPKGNIQAFKKVIFNWETRLNIFGWLSPYLANHDNPRSQQVWGDNRSDSSAKALSLILLSLKGTPFIYFGDELGIGSKNFTSIEQITDPEAQIAYQKTKQEKGNIAKAFTDIANFNRDQGRTPFWWNENKNAGFSDGIPWLGISDGSQGRSAESQIKDPNSILNFYKKMIQVRKSSPSLNQGLFYPLSLEQDSTVNFLRQTNSQLSLVISNLSDTTTQIELPTSIDLDNWLQVIATRPTRLQRKMSLGPYQAAIFMKRVNG
ncbi:alpha-glucosidase [Oenococcus sicerae]|uniref:Alpha-glucosidase n=1 Tax=Oenococcus sicerae TaxID=2203724 RepID=A0AAJ1R9E9_9LACO|nr:alpha-glucosidase [Oenococcus sicerae]MDN6900181.1 alpha-glucosidase [Oenococcus sicerae]